MNKKSQKDVEAGSRARAPNFTREEQELFTRVIEPYKRIIEAKKTDSVKQSDKHRAWAKITEMFNANTTQCSRTTENLLYCYRNMKSRVKKLHSEAKMLLQDPTQKEALITAIEDNGDDWPSISGVTKLPVEVCQFGLEGLKKEVKMYEIQHKKKIMGTGGGPPATDDNPLNRIKKMIEPQIDGLYTSLDSDSELMKQYQESLPENDRILPIENDLILKNEILLKTDGKEKINTSQETGDFVKDAADDCDLWETPQGSKKSVNRTDILKKKSHEALSVGTEKKLFKGRQCSKDSFAVLVEEKVKLVKLNQDVAAEQLKECQLNIELKESEISHRMKLQELELENMKKKNLFEEELRSKELILMDLKIKKISE